MDSASVRVTKCPPVSHDEWQELSLLGIITSILIGLREVPEPMGKNKQLVNRTRQEEKNRDAALSELHGLVEELMSCRKDAVSTIGRCRSLIESVKRTPMDVPQKCRAVASEQKKFKKSDELVRKQFARESIAMGAAVAGVGGLTAAVWQLKDRLAKLLKKRNILAVAIVGIAFLAVGLVWLIASALKKKNSEELSRFIEDCQNVTGCARRKTLEVRELLERTAVQREGLESMLAAVEAVRDAKYGQLDPSQQKSLILLLNGTLGLAQLLNEEVSTQ